MAHEDARVRAELVASDELFHGYSPRMAEVHLRHAKSLEGIVEQHGWPGRSLVGEEGAHAAWLILQHAIANPPLQRRCLPLLKQSAEAGEIDPAQVAYLEDRINVSEGKPQRYGTQHDWDEEGQISPRTLLDEAQVDVYRKSVGLGPLHEKTQQLRRRAMAEGETKPADFAKRQQEMRDWAKSVGWLTEQGDG